jgi:shikimate dehydrogenase
MKKPFISLGLSGYPLGHSYSPAMHNAALAASGIEGDYCLYPIPPSADGNSKLEELVQSIRNGHLCGVNITIPYKQSVQNLVDQLTPLAAHIGAVNVLYMEDGKLVGGNTDCPAFLFDLENSFHFDEPSGLHALVLGAGGSARAVVYALHQEGWNVHVAARNEEQAKDLISNLGISNVQTHNLENEELSLLRDLHLVVNTTPVGMSPDSDRTPWPDGLLFPENAVVYDLIYNPSETRLMKSARKAGLDAVNGLGMLVEQAALSFEIWTGMKAPRVVMRQSVSI